jgi:hypothetical protein
MTTKIIIRSTIYYQIKIRKDLFIKNINTYKMNHHTITTPALSNWREVKLYNHSITSDLKELADAIDRLSLWAWVRHNSPPSNTGYQLWNHPNMLLIHKEIESSPSGTRHSGFSFAFAMRHMQYIAKNGFYAWNQIGQTKTSTSKLKKNKNDNKKVYKKESPTKIGINFIKKSMSYLKIS